jgi:hypothetical protein
LSRGLEPPRHHRPNVVAMTGRMETATHRGHVSWTRTFGSGIVGCGPITLEAEIEVWAGVSATKLG